MPSIRKFERQEKSAPKHIHPSSAQSLIRAPVDPSTINSRPEWKGPGFTKSKKGEKLQTREKNALKAAAAAAAWVDPNGIFFRPGSEKDEDGKWTEGQGLDQKVLDLFRTEFPVIIDADMLKPELERVRLSLLKQDAESAFATKEGREAYAVRWSAGKALAVASLVGGWSEEEKFRDTAVFRRLRGEDGKGLNVVALGGGPAEVYSFAELVRHAQPETVGSVEDGNSGKGAPKIKLQLVDSADWSGEIETLSKALINPPQLSKYASAAAKAAAVPFLAKGVMDVQYNRRDILAPWEDNELKSLIGAEPAMITMISTLLSLQSQSVGKTIKFFMALTKACPKNTLLLVLDEPEAAIAVSEGEKRYPLKFLLELALLGKGVVDEDKEESDDDEEKPKKAEAAWERLEEFGQRNYAVHRELKYPLGLGVVSMQVHLFRRT